MNNKKCREGGEGITSDNIRGPVYTLGQPDQSTHTIPTDQLARTHTRCAQRDKGDQEGEEGCEAHEKLT
jgi:hypothetical protein